MVRLSIRQYVRWKTFPWWYIRAKDATGRTNCHCRLDNWHQLQCFQPCDLCIPCSMWRSWLAGGGVHQRWLCMFTGRWHRRLWRHQKPFSSSEVSITSTSSPPHLNLPSTSPPPLRHTSNDLMFFIFQPFLICALSWVPPRPRQPLTHQQHRDQTTSNLCFPLGLNLKCIMAVTRHSKRREAGKN